jgi:hypothetical protein
MRTRKVGGTAPPSGLPDPAGSPLLRSVPAFAGLSSGHRHDEFASRTACSPPTRGEIGRSTDLDSIAATASARAADLARRWQRLFALIEDARGELFEIDALKMGIAAANARLDAGGRREATVNVAMLRRLTIEAARKAADAREKSPPKVSRRAIRADRLLASIIEADASLTGAGRRLPTIQRGA